MINSISAADTRSRDVIRFNDLLHSEFTKIRTLRATWLALALVCLANTLLGVLAATDAVRVAGANGPTAIEQLGTLLLAPVYIFITIAVFGAGSEYRGGQLRVSLGAVPDRKRLFAAKLTVTAAVSLLAAFPAVLPGYLIQHAAPGDARGPSHFAALVTAYLLLGLIGFGFAVIARTVVTPLAVLFITPTLISPRLHHVLPGAVQFLPHEATLSFLGMPANPPHCLGHGSGALVLLGWAVLVVAGAGAVFVQRDAGS